MGPHLGNNLMNLGIHDQVKQAIGELGLNFDELLEQEDEPGLGNGGLDVSPPASSTRSRRSKSLRSATASVTNSASSSRKS